MLKDILETYTNCFFSVEKLKVHVLETVRPNTGGTFMCCYCYDSYSALNVLHIMADSSKK